MRIGFFTSLLILVAVAGLARSDQPPASSGHTPALELPIAIDAQLPPALESCAAPCLEQGACCFGHGGGRIWGSAEYLHWWIKGGNVPPLVTVGSETGLGVLGDPDTRVLYSGNVNFSDRSGGRFTFGTGLNCDCTKGIELGYFFLGSRSNRFGVSSAGALDSGVLSRPFFNVISEEQTIQIVAFPGFTAGSVQIASTSSLQGADMNLYCNLCCRPACCQTDCCPSDCCPSDCCPTAGARGTSYRLDVFAGPRWLQLNEDLAITEQVTDPIDPNDPGFGTSYTLRDRFATRNNFYGAQVGARAEWQRGLCFVNLSGKLALGTTHQEVRIAGTTVFNEPGLAPNVQQGALLALPTNIGTYSRNRFAVVPEIGINVGCQVTEHVRVFTGYTFMYWSNVVRPGDQIDVGINATQVPSAAGPNALVGEARPAFAFHDTSFWVQGINVGLELQW